MTNVFLDDMLRTALIFLTVYAVTVIYYFYSTKGANTSQGSLVAGLLAAAKKLITSKYAFGPAALAGIVALLFADSLPGILTIGGFFMGLLYFVFSQRP